MKILYIHHIDGQKFMSGWTQASIDLILAMDSVGLDVIPRGIQFKSERPDLPKRYLELEQKSAEGCNICIQHVLPDHLQYNGQFDKNIAYFVMETDSISNSNWINKLRLMDEVWVPNTEMKFNLGVNNISVIPHASDTSKYTKQYPKFKHDFENKFVFYFIGEFTRRKNITALLKAYNLEFTLNDNVGMLIKTHRSGHSQQDVVKQVLETNKVVREQLRLYTHSSYYPYVGTIAHDMTKEELYGFHQSCDCFVSASFGESWNIPAMDAMGFDNWVIHTDQGGPHDYLDVGLVEGREEPCFGADAFVNHIHTGRENWVSIDINYLRKEMRDVYRRQTKSYSNTKHIQQYSYESIGNKIKECLSNS